MIAGLKRWLRGDDAADRRIRVLEGELATARQIAAASAERYLRRLARCRGCVTCNPEPQGLEDLDYDTKLIGDA